MCLYQSNAILVLHHILGLHNHTKTQRLIFDLSIESPK